ncbi:recombination directionality factor [Streptomyces hydrogenans]|uniref:recombination directionality factor n=1 Tax=Streptomyces hydrogenans TaxID=1873719 RepID=UPI0035DCB112
MANNLRRIWDADPEAAPKDRTSFADDVVGRFRSGRLIKMGSKDVPEALNEWRVTTGDPVVAARVAELMGGVFEEWETDKEDNLQILTESPSVAIIIEPDGVDASFKQFAPGAGLIHHCDGFEYLSPEEDKGTPCKCPTLIAERKLAADKMRGPKPSVDVRFRMAEAPELGIFRFNSGSWKLVEVLGPLFSELDKYPGQPVRATLTIENVSFTPQKGPRAGQEVSYNKPVIKILGAAEAAGDADLPMAA